MSSQAKSGGVSFAGLLTIAFIVLKLCNVIAWSWIWVLCPLWISFAIAVAWWIGVIIAAFVAVAFAALFAALFG
jgi:hypothetical protein